MRWMGGRAVEGTGLENRQTGDRLVGSNPTPSARDRYPVTFFKAVRELSHPLCHPFLAPPPALGRWNEKGRPMRRPPRSLLSHRWLSANSVEFLTPFFGVIDIEN